MREYNVHEVLSILQEYHITDSQQMVTRWIREGKISGIRSENRKDGYRVSEDDLYEFIEEQRPGLKSIYDVYNEYIKKLKLNDVEEQIIEPEQIKTKEPEGNAEIDELKKQLQYFEGIISDLQDERQIIEMQLIDIMDQNKQLIEENKMLHELYEVMDDDIKKLMECIDKHQKNSVKKTKEAHIPVDEFKKLITSIIKALGYKLDDIQEHVAAIYNLIHEESGKIKEELMCKNGEIRCPFTKKAYKQKKRLVNSLVSHYFKKLSENGDQTQLELKMAID